VTFWSSWTLSQPRRPEKKFIQPGRDTTPAPPPALIAPPQLQVPNRERDISGIQIAGGVAPKQMPALPRAPSTTMPVQMIAPPEITSSSDASLDVHQGEPASVVALNMNPAPPRDIVSIPRVNQVGKLPRVGEGNGSEAGSSASSSGAGSSSSGTDSSSSGTDSSSSGTGSSSSGTDSSSKEARGSGNGAGGIAGGTGGIAGGAAGAVGRKEAGPPKSGSALDVPGRMVHPVDGVFDMVVVHLSPADGSLEDAKLLTGKPVYTVYLRVGTPKEWVLRYCVPKSGSSRNSGMVIQLTPPSPVTAPYPRVTVTPPKPVLARPVRTVLHGFLATNGFFRNLTTVNPEDAEFGTRISSFLSEWEFRPASRDGKPVEVEVVLAIPAHEI
jgi:hypothetical protein